MSEHTAGPWRLEDYTDQISIVAVGLSGCTRFGVPGEWDVANVDGDDTFLSASEAQANARLIAAAPQLLEALEDAEKKLQQARVITGLGFPSTRIKARAAIKAARGEA